MIKLVNGMVYLFVFLLLLVGSVFSIGIMTFLKRKKLGIILVIIGLVGLAIVTYIFNQPGVMGTVVLTNDSF